MARTNLNGRQFAALHSKILDRYKKDLTAQPVDFLDKSDKKTYKYGFDAGKDYAYSIRAMMMADSSIAEYLSNQNQGIESNHKEYVRLHGKTLYRKIRQAIKEPFTVIKLSEPYSKVYFWYAGFRDQEDFLNQIATEEKATPYRGYYFSQMDREVKSFSCSFLEKDDGYEVEVAGFHESDRFDPFRGSGRRKNSNLFVDLEASRGDNFMQLVLHLQEEKKQLRDYLLGILLTVTTKDFPLSVRIILAKIEHPGAELDKAEELKIVRYLNLHRLSLRAPTDRIKKLDDLSIRGQNVDDLKNIRGEYCLLGYYGNDLVLANMQIDEAFAVSLTNPFYEVGSYREQYGVISISKEFRHFTCLTFYSRGDKAYLQPIGTLIFEFPDDSSFKLLEGIHSAVGNSRVGPFGGAVALYRQPLGDKLPEDMKARKIKAEIIADLFRKGDTNAELIQLKTMLDVAVAREKKG